MKSWSSDHLNAHSPGSDEIAASPRTSRTSPRPSPPSSPSPASKSRSDAWQEH